MIIVVPDADEDFESNETPKIVNGVKEYEISELKLEGEDPKGGAFTVSDRKFRLEPSLDWLLMPSSRDIFITYTGVSGHGTECRFEFRS